MLTQFHRRIAFYFGVIKTGAVAITLSNLLTGEELTNLLAHARPKMVFGIRKQAQ
jgi:acyl-CoA synthetase (AMP-forming)/AMP-acid ligase II